MIEVLEDKTRKLGYIVASDSEDNGALRSEIKARNGGVCRVLGKVASTKDVQALVDGLPKGRKK